MLKRYTHLRANRLVHKLEGTQNKERLAILNHLVHYPGIVVKESPKDIKIVFPDFAPEVVSTSFSGNFENAVAAAQDLLLRTLFGLIKEGRKLPPPDQYLDSELHGKVVMIDPMAMA